MKALNEKEAVVLHAKFAAYMVVLIVLTLFFIFTFWKTSEAEISEIKMKTGDCENIYRMQNELCDDIDELLNRYRSFDVVEDVNSEFLMRSIVDRKMEISKKISQIPAKDVKVHAFLISKMDDLLRVRDSISAMKKEEARAKNDLFICNGEYKKLSKDRRNSQFLK
ncbi:MAG: type VI secretion system TssO [Paludibacteraceae bacterium]|nr:type VI secretion system TssO [Paludibacteraceae bacterium]